MAYSQRLRPICAKCNDALQLDLQQRIEILLMKNCGLWRSVAEFVAPPVSALEMVANSSNTAAEPNGVQRRYMLPAPRQIKGLLPAAALRCKRQAGAIPQHLSYSTGYPHHPASQASAGISRGMTASRPNFHSSIVRRGRYAVVCRRPDAQQSWAMGPIPATETADRTAVSSQPGNLLLPKTYDHLQIEKHSHPKWDDEHGSRT